MKKQNRNGYTLVELLAVIIILITVGAIISAILTSVLRSSNKSANTESVRRNGNYAITQMSRMISYAQKLEGVSVSGNFNDPTQYQTDCVSQVPPLTQYKYLKIQSFDRGITTFVCNDSKISSQSASGINYLVDPSLTAACYFNCVQESAAAPAKIDIFLNLSVRNSANFSESQAEIPFETSVIIKNSGSR
jgi:type II secretory pathway pseudopilin PulG